MGTISVRSETTRGRAGLARVPLAALTVTLIACALPSPAPASGRAGYRQPRSAGHRSMPRHRGPLARASIIGGVFAEDAAFPWMAYVIDRRGDRVGLCTGTVVSPNVVLTAAHCAENMETGVVNDPAGYEVVTGNVEWSSPSRQVSTVSRVVIYPGFLRGYAVGDAALLVLSSPVAAPAIGLASWPSDSTDLEAGKAAVIAGWGSSYYAEASLTERLQWAETGIQKAAYCETRAAPFFRGKELCSVDPPRYETGACEGDSGGPLISRNPAGGGVIEIGIASHVYGACATTRPTVFTRTDLVAAWAHSWIDAARPLPAIPPSAAPPAGPGAQAAPPATAPSLPPNGPGLYVAAGGVHGPRIAVRVSGDGKHLVAVAIRATIQCQRGHTYALRGSWLSYRDNVPIPDHVGATTLTTASDKHMTRGSIGIHVYFDKPGSLQGRLRIRIRSSDRSAGMCSGALTFNARVQPGS